MSRSLTLPRLRRSFPLPHAGEGGARRVSGRRVRACAPLLALPLLSACAATQTPAAIAPAAPGFLLGLWHGFIFPVAWLVSLFTDDVAIYAVPNSGGWYDFGYFLGIVVFGVGARKTHTVTRDRVVHVPIKDVTPPRHPQE